MILVRPTKPTAAFKAAALIYQEGPMMPAALFSRVDFGVASDIRNGTLRRAIASGWLEMLPNGAVDMTCASYVLMESELGKGAEKFVGTVAASRDINWQGRKAYVPPKPVLRSDIPAWSLRSAGFTIHTVA